MDVVSEARQVFARELLQRLNVASLRATAYRLNVCVNPEYYIVLTRNRELVLAEEPALWYWTVHQQQKYAECSDHIVTGYAHDLDAALEDAAIAIAAYLLPVPVGQEEVSDDCHERGSQSDAHDCE